jgi:RNA polymerase sigma factor (TIGR02999 family)
VTEVLAELRRDTPGARDELLQLVYSELRRLAESQMRRQPKGHTLQPTALVHEAYLKLLGGDDAPWSDRSHFLTAAARAMRSILVDFARGRAALKRGAGKRPITLDEDAHAGQHASDEVIAVHEALEKLTEIDPQGGRVVELRFFGGLTAEETAKSMGVAESTVYRSWEHARSWLFREIAS